MRFHTLAAITLCAVAPGLAHAQSHNDSNKAAPLSSYASEFVKKPLFSKSYQTMATLPLWVRTGQGTSDVVSPVTIEGKAYLITNICEPHNCQASQFDFIFSKDGKQAWGLLSTFHGKKLYQMPMGEPSDAILNALTKAFMARNPGSAE